MPRQVVTGALFVFLLTAPVWAGDPKEDLWVAARKGDAKAVEALLAKGVDVNAKTSYGVSALWFATYKNRPEVVRMLLKRKADVNVKDDIWGLTPLSMAIEEKQVEIVKLLLEAGATGADAALLAAANQGQSDLLRAILDKRKAKPEVLTAALVLAPSKHPEIAEMLKKAGARPLAKSASKTEMQMLTALQGTFESQRGETLKISLKDGYLLAGSGYGAPFVLKAVGGSAFKPLGHDTISITFERRGDKVPRFTMKRDGADVEFNRVNAEKIPEPRLPKIDDRPAKVTSPQNWPSFRGPNASGVADGQMPPASWDAKHGINVLWKTSIPGLGHSCPIIWGDRVFVTTAISGDPKATIRTGLYGDVDSVNDQTIHSWRVYSLDKHSGRIIWERTANQGVPKIKRHLKASHANCTPATDGHCLVACFGSEGLYCYDFDGKLLWKHDLGFLDASFFLDPEKQWGFGSSPIIYRDLVIIQCDVGKNSFIAAYRLADGRQVWSTPRDEIPSWGTPTVYEGPTGNELITNGTNYVRGYDLKSGKELWRLARNAEITVPTPIVGHGLIFVTSGYRPIQPIYAIRPGATGDISLKENSDANGAIAWSKKRGGPYMPTPIVYGPHLYTCSNNGLITCYEAKTGKQVYQKRIGGSGAYTASPVAADGKLYFTSEEGNVRVVRAGPAFELLAINPMGDVCMATPAISDGMLFIRSQHYLFGIGRADTQRSSRSG